MRKESRQKTCRCITCDRSDQRGGSRFRGRTVDASLTRADTKVSASAAAERAAITAAYDKAVRDVGTALTAANAAAELDDAVAVATAEQQAEQALLGAWQAIRAMNARAPETFAGSAPGGMGVTLVAFSANVGAYTDVIWAGLEGIGHGGAMVLNVSRCIRSTRSTVTSMNSSKPTAAATVLSTERPMSEWEPPQWQQHWQPRPRLPPGPRRFHCRHSAPQ